MNHEHNWSNSYTYHAARIHSPESIDEIRRLVAGSAKIHALGTRHSFNGVADTAGDLVDLRALRSDPVVDAKRQTVTVAAGTPYGQLARFLQSQGLALHNLGSLPHISVAGAISTGTHGSGDKNGSLSSAVAALELVTSSGDLLKIRRGDAGFDGMVVGLGAFGIITHVTLDVRPSFDVRQDGFVDLQWSSVLSNLDEIMSAAYSVSIMTHWSGITVGRLWLKTRLPGKAVQDVAISHLGVKAAQNASATGENDALEGLTEFGVPGPWSERLCHFRPDCEPGITEQIQSEYMVPRRQAVTALARLRAIAERIDQHLLLTEIRSVAADDLWLSSSYGQDMLALHFTWKQEPAPVHAITAEIEEMLLPLGARPHWGKIIHSPASRLAQVYPRLADFQALAAQYDPAGKFRNAFLDYHILAP